MILNDLNKAAMGTVPVKKIFLGSILIYPKGGIVPPDNEIWYETSDGQIIDTQPNFPLEPGTSPSRDVAHVIEHSYGRIVCDNPIEWIGQRQFRNCERLTSILFPNSVRGFYQGICYSNTLELTKVYIPSLVYELGIGNFNAPLTELTLPPLELIRDNCLNNLNVPTLIIPDTVKEIQHYCFNKCQGKMLIMSKNIQIIGTNSFNRLDIGTLNLPTSLRSIGEYSFTFCSNLSTINYQGTMAQWKEVEIGEEVFDKSMALVVHCSDGDVEI